MKEGMAMGANPVLKVDDDSLVRLDALNTLLKNLTEMHIGNFGKAQIPALRDPYHRCYASTEYSLYTCPTFAYGGICIRQELAPIFSLGDAGTGSWMAQAKSSGIHADHVHHDGFGVKGECHPEKIVFLVESKPN